MPRSNTAYNSRDISHRGSHRGCVIGWRRRFVPTGGPAKTRSVAKATCSLNEKYCPVKYESFLVEANICESQYVWEWKRALADLVCWEKDTEPYNERKRIATGGYEVIRVTASPGYGKSALLRYLQEIVKPDSRIGGTRPRNPEPAAEGGRIIL